MLRSIHPARLGDLVLGQYTKSADGSRPGYTDDETVPPRAIHPLSLWLHCMSVTSVGRAFRSFYAAARGLNEQKAEIRIQFADVPGPLFGPVDCSPLTMIITMNLTSLPRITRKLNAIVSLVMNSSSGSSRTRPFYMKLMVKRPGHGMHPMLSDLDLSYASRYSQLRIPDAYESLLLDILRGINPISSGMMNSRKLGAFSPGPS